MRRVLLVPGVVRWVRARAHPGSNELARPVGEEAAPGSRAARIHRVLVPIRRDDAETLHSIEAFLLERMGRRGQVSLTLLSTATRDGRVDAAGLLERVAPLFARAAATRMISESGDPVGAILDEARNGYDLVVLGATEKPEAAGASRFDPVADRVARMAPVPTVVVRAGRRRSPWPPRRILLLTNGSAAARPAAEIASLLADEARQELIVVAMLDRPAAIFRLPRTRRDRREREAASALLEEMQTLGGRRGVRTTGQVLEGGDLETVILRFVREVAVDLVVLGCSVRLASDRGWVGARARGILDGLSCPALVVTAS
jgi:nucleotide-binding universal stress UspA family protein